VGMFDIDTELLKENPKFYGNYGRSFRGCHKIIKHYYSAVDSVGFIQEYWLVEHFNTVMQIRDARMGIAIGCRPWEAFIYDSSGVIIAVVNTRSTDEYGNRCFEVSIRRPFLKERIKLRTMRVR
jgi:hypothetical protein